MNTMRLSQRSAAQHVQKGGARHLNVHEYVSAKKIEAVEEGSHLPFFRLARCADAIDPCNVSWRCIDEFACHVLMRVE